jgi:hypothetical protein
LQAFTWKSEGNGTLNGSERSENSRICELTVGRRLGGHSSYRSFVLLRKLPLFESMEPACLEDVAGRLQDVRVPQGEHVVRAGEAGDGMYFVHAGSVQVLVEAVPVDVLGAGCFFGEVALTSEAPRSADVVSLGATRGLRCNPQGSPLGRRRVDPAQLFKLTKADFDEVVARYPGLEERLHEVGMARVRRACSPHSSPLCAVRRCSSFAAGEGPGRFASPASGDGDRSGRLYGELYTASPSSLGPGLGALGLPQRRKSDSDQESLNPRRSRPGLRIDSPPPPPREPGEGPGPALLGFRRMSDMLIDEDGEGSLDSWRADSREAATRSAATGAGAEEAGAMCLESLSFLLGAGPPTPRNGSPHSQRSGSPASHRSGRGSPASRRSVSPISGSRGCSPLPCRME